MNKHTFDKVERDKLYECIHFSTYWLVRATDDCVSNNSNTWSGEIIKCVPKTETDNVCYFSFNDWWHEVTESGTSTCIYDKLKEMLST